MSVYEAVRVCKEKGIKVYEKVNVTTILKHICCLGLGVLYSLAGFNESFSPFGVAFASCVSDKFTLTATLGACIGYFVALDSVNALRYTADVLALAVIMTALKAFNNLRNHPFSSVVVTFVCVFVTGMATAFSEGFALYNFIIAICEASVGAAASYTLSKSKTYLTVRGGLGAVTSKEITAIIISGSLLLMAFKYVNIFEISFAHIIAVFVILICSFYGKEAGGAVVGICSGLSTGLENGNLFVLSFYSLGGLLSGAFSGFGRFASLASFAVSGIVVAVISGYSDGLIAITIETGIAALIFIFITQKFNFQLSGFFSPSVSSPVIDSVKSNIINKLHRASEFSTEICTTLDSVNAALSKSEKSDVNHIPKKVKGNVCAACGLYDTCWREMKEQMKLNFDNLLDLKKRGVYLEYKSVPASFSSVCIRTDNISSAFNKFFSECKVNEKTEKRIKEIQSLASEQFVNVSQLLDSLCEEIDEDVRFDMDIAARCRAVCLSMGLQAVDCCCIGDNFDKISIEIRFKKPVELKLLNSLTNQISLIAARSIDNPEIDDFEDYIRAVYKEKPELNIVSAGVQFNANGEKYSGDTYSTFRDNKGYFYTVICDGMGTGVKAAVSSSLAVTLLEKLIKAGFGINAAINTVNTSLVSKSGDECSVTLDLIAVDMYTGRVEFYKCGSQNTLVKRNGKICDIKFESLPLGILSDVEISSGNGTVGVGDVIIMCSDGVRDEDFWQLRNALKVFDNGNVRNFTTDIAEIIRRSQPEKNDDFTMVTLAVTHG